MQASRVSKNINEIKGVEGRELYLEDGDKVLAGDQGMETLGVAVGGEIVAQCLECLDLVGSLVTL